MRLWRIARLVQTMLMWIAIAWLASAAMFLELADRAPLVDDDGHPLD